MAELGPLYYACLRAEGSEQGLHMDLSVLHQDEPGGHEQHITHLENELTMPTTRALTTFLLNTSICPAPHDCPGASEWLSGHLLSKVLFRSMLPFMPT